jgi:hypothetical protein
MMKCVLKDGPSSSRSLPRPKKCAGDLEMFVEESGDEIDPGGDLDEFEDPGAAEGRDETASRAPAEEEEDEEEEPVIRRSRGTRQAAAAARSSSSDASDDDLSVSSAAQAELDRAHEERKRKAAERRRQRGK